MGKLPSTKRSAIELHTVLRTHPGAYDVLDNRYFPLDFILFIPSKRRVLRVRP